jgi:hypothetical protein
MLDGLVGQAVEWEGGAEKLVPVCSSNCGWREDDASGAVGACLSYELGKEGWWWEGEEDFSVVEAAVGAG